MKKLAVVLGVVAGMILTTGGATAETGGNQRFTVIVSGRGEDGFDVARVVASGPIRGVGTFEETEDPEVVRFVFPRGSVLLDVPNAEESDDFNERSCSGSFTFSGPFTIIEGTGAYAGAEGSGTFEGRGRYFGRPTADGECSFEDNFFFFIVNAKGTVNLAGQAAA